MSTSTVCQAKYDFSPGGKGQLALKVGDQFTIVSKTSPDWWTVRSSRGELGLAPVTYLEVCKEKEDTPPRIGSTPSPTYVTLYDFTGQDNTQLSFKRGETVQLVDKTDPSWWSMQKKSGEIGLVPVNYIDKQENVPGDQRADGTSSPYSWGGSSEDDMALTEVLLSVDRAMQKIHDEATSQGGSYTPEQRSTLQSLVVHRQNVVDDRKKETGVKGGGGKDHLTTPSVSSTPSPSTSPAHTQVKHVASAGTRSPIRTPGSPRARRAAPPPPTQAGGSGGGAKKSGSRSTRPVSMWAGTEHPDHLKYNGKKAAPEPPQRRGSESRGDYSNVTPGTWNREVGHSSPSGSTGSSSGGRTMSQERLPVRSATVSLPSRTTRTVISTNEVATANGGVGLSSFSTFLPRDQPSNYQTRWSGTGETRRSSSITEGSPTRAHSNRQLNMDGRRRSSISVDSPQMVRQRSRSSHSPGTPPASPIKLRSASNSPHIVRKARSRQGSLDSSPGGGTGVAPRVELPNSFLASDGGDLVETVRVRTSMSYQKSLLAVSGVLEFLKNKVPVCSNMVDALLTAVQESQSTAIDKGSSTQVTQSHDLERLREIFFQLQECKDDSQQRGWAVHDDQQAIMDYLQELLQILCDADPDVTKMAVQEDKYENVLTLITYYQMEARVPIRLLLLKVFGVLCGMDKVVISVLLTSVLPNELGREMQDDLPEIQKTLYSATVCTMMFSTSEAIPLTVYDQWNVEYVLFLLDTIESPPDEDEEDQIPDAFLNVILSFNQHFRDPSGNLVMSALRQRSNPRNFSEKLMFLVNRGEDPVAITTPCSPDSLTKFLLDLFADSDTSGMFYTTDMMVLIDIVSRQLHDLGPGDETRTHYLELLYRIVSTTDYKEHRHRQKDLTSYMNRIAGEEGAESLADQELVKKIWITFPGVFEEVTDL